MTKRLEICIDINIEISEVDHYMWIFASRVFRLALKQLLSDVVLVSLLLTLNIFHTFF